jgi:DNA-binding NarL/FixJ family response regulator
VQLKFVRQRNDFTPALRNGLGADQLSIAEDTVKWRVKNILSKLGARDRTQAAMIGMKRGIIEP